MQMQMTHNTRQWLGHPWNNVCGSGHHSIGTKYADARKNAKEIHQDVAWNGGLRYKDRWNQLELFP